MDIISVMVGVVIGVFIKRYVVGFLKAVFTFGLMVTGRI